MIFFIHSLEQLSVGTKLFGVLLLLLFGIQIGFSIRRTNQSCLCKSVFTFSSASITNSSLSMAKPLRQNSILNVPCLVMVLFFSQKLIDSTMRWWHQLDSVLSLILFSKEKSRRLKQISLNGLNLWYSPIAVTSVISCHFII